MDDEWYGLVSDQTSLEAVLPVTSGFGDNQTGLKQVQRHCEPVGLIQAELQKKTHGGGGGRRKQRQLCLSRSSVKHAGARARPHEAQQNCSAVSAHCSAEPA